ncbi:dicarboxylate/amino acid:cation symporter [Propionivibrio dicarboxylicus]|uniref:Na+/H+-dicarboxylate symporter n=1 Tax=Propionivibrio dicarboxylicus TaxID=83767 RepID=A0A1G7Z3E8_9RHOO|nr:dicarboxylate/amino acid:cation symporter [Propionivibrio dicarboxylicus]SDH03238.1 Na+/H+-dicarboxylate symporter [Propionivibrio dicarboxylicus]
MSLLRKIRGISLSNKIFFSMILGIAFGLIFGKSMGDIKFIGDAWINFLKMTITPFILLTIVTTVGGHKSAQTIGKIAIFIVVFYTISALVGIGIGIGTMSVFKPGAGFTGFAEYSTKSLAQAATDGFSFKSLVMSMFADNFFKPFVEGSIMQVLVIGLFMGLVILKMPDGEVKTGILKWFQNIHALFNKMIALIMEFGPIGVFCLMSAVMGQYGKDFIGSIGSFIGVVYLSLALLIVLWYLPLVGIIAKIAPTTFLKKSLPLTVYTMSTCSSAAAIPISLNVCDDLKINRQISSFVIPLGSQISMDGMALFLPAILMFGAQAMGIEFSYAQLFQMAIMSVLIANGGGGIPNAGLIKVIIMIQAFGIPLEMGAIVGAFYRIFDMGVTTLNCMEDLVGASVSNKIYGKSLDTHELQNVGIVVPAENTAV